MMSPSFGSWLYLSLTGGVTSDFGLVMQDLMHF